MGDYFKFNENVSSKEVGVREIGQVIETLTSLELMETPVLYDPNNPDARLFFVLADGTGNNLSDPNKFTNVAKLREDLKPIVRANPNIAFIYKEGVGTQPNKASAMLDGAIGYSVTNRAKDIYKKLSNQATAWKRENPNAQISVILVGFSRGCAVASYLNQMIHKEGIVNMDEKTITGTNTIQSHPKLIDAKEIKQAVLLFDPVHQSSKELSEPSAFALSDSTLSALQINAADEFRTLFPLTVNVKQGLSSNRLCAAISLPGAHSDIGGSYPKDGLGRLSDFVGRAYLNALTDNLLPQTKLSPDLFVHNSREHWKGYSVTNPRLSLNKTNPYIEARAYNGPATSLSLEPLKAFLFTLQEKKEAALSVQAKKSAPDISLAHAVNDQATAKERITLTRPDPSFKRRRG